MLTLELKHSFKASYEFITKAVVVSICALEHIGRNKRESRLKILSRRCQTKLEIGPIGFYHQEVNKFWLKQLQCIYDELFQDSTQYMWQRELCHDRATSQSGMGYLRWSRKVFSSRKSTEVHAFFYTWGWITDDHYCYAMSMG